MTALACVQDVLQAAEGDVNAAAWMLAELHSPVTPGMSPSMSPSISPWASPLGSPLGSPHVSPARSHMPLPHSSPRPPDLPSIAEVAGQGSRHAGRPARRERAPSNHAAGPQFASRKARVASEPGRIENAAQPGVRAAKKTAESQRADLQRGDAQDAEAGDAYHSFRGEALQLTRRWQSAARKATSAFSGEGTAHGSTHVHASLAAGLAARKQQTRSGLRRCAEGAMTQASEPEVILVFWACRRQSLRGAQVCSGGAPSARESAQGARAGGRPHRGSQQCLQGPRSVDPGPARPAWQ